MKYFTLVGDTEHEFVIERREGELIARCGDRLFRLDFSSVGDGSTFSLLVDGVSHDVLVHRVDAGLAVEVAGERVVVRVQDQRERAAQAVGAAPVAGQRQVRAAMPGTVVDIQVSEGQDVAEGQTLLVLEAMKMRNPIAAESAGRVAKIRIGLDQAVAAGEPLVDLE